MALESIWLTGFVTVEGRAFRHHPLAHDEEFGAKMSRPEKFRTNNIYRLTVKPYGDYMQLELLWNETDLVNTDSEEGRRLHYEIAANTDKFF